MSAPKYHRGQTIAYSLRIGATASKRVVGEIAEVVHNGYRVKVDGRPGVFFLRASQIRPVDSSETPEVTELADSAQPPPAVAPTEPEPAEPDPIEAWLARGRELLSTAQHQVDREEAAVAHADREVAEARTLLAATEATATGARNRLRLAIERRAEIERRTGGDR